MVVMEKTYSIFKIITKKLIISSILLKKSLIFFQDSFKQKIRIKLFKIIWLMDHQSLSSGGGIQQLRFCYSFLGWKRSYCFSLLLFQICSSSYSTFYPLAILSALSICSLLRGVKVRSWWCLNFLFFPLSSLGIKNQLSKITQTKLLNESVLINLFIAHIKMSKSSRQIQQLKQTPNVNNSAASIPAHRRNKSVQNRNFSMLLQKCRNLYMNNQMLQAIQCLKRGLYYDPQNLQLHFMLGMAHLTLNEYVQALIHLQTVSNINNRFKNNLYLLISIAYKKKGDSRSALSALSQQIALYEDAQSLFYRAKIYLNQNKSNFALQDLNKLLLKYPNHALALLMRIRILSSLQRYNEALEVIRIGKITIEQIDKQQQIRLEQAFILSSLGKFQQALQCIHKVEKEFAVLGHEVQLAKGRILQKLNRQQEAVILYNQILERSSDSKSFCQAVAEVSIYYLKERDYYQAFSYLKRTHLIKVKSKPTDNLLRLSQGLTFLMKKKYAEAILLLGACQLQFRYSLAQHSIFLCNLCLNGLAFGNFSLGNHSSALQLYKKINKNDPKTDIIAVNYNMSICEGILLYQREKKQQAIQSFHKSYSFVPRPQPFFYIAVIQNQDSLRGGIDTESFSRTLQLIERGLRAGESAHMYYYRAVIYMFLGMNTQALEDIDRAIQKSQDNVARYFHARGILFMLDKNYQQAASEFATALSIDETADDSAAQKGKCELLSGDISAAYNSIQGLARQEYWRIYFQLYEKDYDSILHSDCQDQSILQICHFMTGKFELAGPSGKLIIAILYQNYSEVVKLIEEAVSLGVSVGCLDLNDLLILQAFSQYRLQHYQESAQTLTKVERSLRETNSHTETYCEEDQRKLLLCKVNQIMINFKRDHKIEALQLTQDLLAQVCEGFISDELHRLRTFLVQGGQYELGFGTQTYMISDYFQDQHIGGIKFKFLIPMPHPKIHQVQDPQYEQLLTGFRVQDIENKPEAPWIKRGEYGVIFTNQMKEFSNLNLKTEENEAIKSKMPNSLQKMEQTRQRLKRALELSKSVIDKLDKLTKKNQFDEL